MTQIAYLLLCHRDAPRIARQARLLMAMGDRVAIHLDARAPDAVRTALIEELSDEPGVAFVRPMRCGWGDWSLVAATLRALRTAREAFPAATHFYLISGDCLPIKPARQIRSRLEVQAADWIDAQPFATSDFIKTGLREERLIYRFPFNERRTPRLFYGALAAQQRLGLARTPPGDIEVMIGSQWWCLRRATVDRVLDFIAARPDVVRYFRTTWIPDETFFQTLVRHLVPTRDIVAQNPTFVHFTDYGAPVVLHDDHYDLVISEDRFFARKIAPEARSLQSRLKQLYASKETVEIGGDLRRLHGFLTGLGRIGARHAPRAWESVSTLDARHRLIVLTCKKWHVAKRLQHRLQAAGVPGVHYVFHENDAEVPNLGGFGDTVAARLRDPVAFLRLILDALGSDTMVLCLDPSAADRVSQLAASGASVTCLHLDCTFADDYLDGHATRVKLADATTPASVRAALLPALRAGFAAERDALTAVPGIAFFEIAEAASRDQNADALAMALRLDRDTADRILSAPDLFAD